MEYLNRYKSAGLLLGLLLMIMGVIFLAAPERIAEIVAVFAGALVTAIGLIRVIIVAFQWNYTANRTLLTMIGLAITGIGIFMLFNPQATITIIGAVIGLLAILLAIERFVTANRLKNEINVWPTVISGLVHLAFGIGMIYSAVVVFSIIIILAGVYLLITGIMFILSTLFFHDF